MMRFDSTYARELTRLRDDHLLRDPVTFEGLVRPKMDLDGRAILNFCSNNYLGLANDPRIVAAMRSALSDHGVSSAASRLVSGNVRAHVAAEQALADYLQVESTLLFSSGYVTNVSTIAALVGREDVVFSDELNHASLIDGCRLCRSQTYIYRHKDIEHLRQLLREYRGSGRQALVITDAVFSMDGDIAPVKDIRRLCDEFEAGMMVDEAHAFGVLGPSGRGICASEEVEADVITATLGKSAGLAGAFVGANQTIVQWLRNRARGFVFSTGPVPALSAAIPIAVSLLERADDRRTQVLSHAESLAKSLRELRYEASFHGTPIVPVMTYQPDTTMNFSQRLLDKGFFVQGIRPPTVPPGRCRLRLVPMATHRTEEIKELLLAFAELN